MNTKKYYDLKEISSLLKTRVPYLRKLLKEKKLKGIFIGRQYLVEESDLQEYIDSIGVRNGK